MVEMSGGEALVKSLVNEGVDTVFGIPGIQMYGIVAAIRDEPGIRMITTRHEQATTYIDSGYQFNLGYAFPTALGAKVARPDRPVVCMAGDGGFMFNASELSTAVQYGINVTTVIFRNDSYGNVARDLEDMFGGA